MKLSCTPQYSQPTSIELSHIDERLFLWYPVKKIEKTKNSHPVYPITCLVIYIFQIRLLENIAYLLNILGNPWLKFVLSLNYYFNDNYKNKKIYLKNMQDIYKIAETTLVQNIDDVHNDVLIIENEDMEIVSRQKIALRYYNQAKPIQERHLWVVKELSKNKKDDVVMIKILYVGQKKPEWIPYSDNDMETFI